MWASKAGLAAAAIENRLRPPRPAGSLSYYRSMDIGLANVTILERIQRLSHGPILVGARVLLTGHTGFKGAWLSLWLEMLGAEVFGLALAPATEPSLFSLTRQAVYPQSAMVDLRDRASVGAFVEVGPATDRDPHGGTGARRESTGIPWNIRYQRHGHGKSARCAARNKGS